jgi:lysine 6-dehydrogenase
MLKPERRCALVGCGAMGAAAAVELLRGARGSRVSLLLVDRDADRLRQLTSMLSTVVGEQDGCDIASVITPHVGDADDSETLEAIGACDVVATALSWTAARSVTRFAIDRGLPVVGIGRPPTDPRGEFGAAGHAPFIAGAGLEPGLTEILARRLATAFDPGVHLRLYCGGVPRHPRPPMRHVSWYGPHLTITPRPAYRVATGTLEVVERFSGVELVDVPGVGVLEAFYDGLLPWIHADSVLGQAAVIDQKTLRWPGFSAKVVTLNELGLLSETPVATPEGPARPRAVLDAVLRPHIERRPEDEDVTVLAVEATGSIAGSPATRSTAVVATPHPNFGVTGMGRLTGGVLASAVRLLGEHVTPDGLAAERPTGVIHAHEAFSGDRAENLLDSLRREGVSVVDCPHSWTGRVGGEHLSEDSDERV